MVPKGTLRYIIFITSGRYHTLEAGLKMKLASDSVVDVDLVLLGLLKLKYS
jgi:hypothetical protein